MRIELVLYYTTYYYKVISLFPIRALLDRGDGMPLRSYFVVNKGVMLAVLSNVVTYLIILIEFELNDQENEDVTEAILNECNNATSISST